MFKLHTKKYKFENEHDVMLTDIFSLVKKLQKNLNFNFTCKIPPRKKNN